MREAARRNPDFLVIGRTSAVRASTMDDEHERLGVIELEKLLAVERETVENG